MGKRGQPRHTRDAVAIREDGKGSRVATNGGEGGLQVRRQTPPRPQALPPAFRVADVRFRRGSDPKRHRLSPPLPRGVAAGRRLDPVLFLKVSEELVNVRRRRGVREVLRPPSIEQLSQQAAALAGKRRGRIGRFVGRGLD